ncbi:MAG: hypothetical protein AUJ96_12765 [Armatimonadetes bacterium CG2_30_66_41]|nr:MAG: hypothetical protein AUJ96_12765 [Armatimonadetes bacterium CG2_30_66_41]
MRASSFGHGPEAVDGMPAGGGHSPIDEDVVQLAKLVDEAEPFRRLAEVGRGGAPEEPLEFQRGVEPETLETPDEPAEVGVERRSAEEVIPADGLAVGNWQWEDFIQQV